MAPHTPPLVDGNLRLRAATPDDQATLERWDREPHVISATTDDPNEEVAFGDHDWAEELAMQTEVFRYFIAELDGRGIGAMLIIDPALEPTHYWDDCAPDQRALDIWIGAASDLSQGHGARMMRLAVDHCFNDPRVTTLLIDPLASNTRAHRFYERMGFTPVGRRSFGPDDCLVFQMTRQDWRKETINA